MTWPGVPTSLSGAYVIGETDESVQGRVITRLGKPWGLWYDDTTPDLESVWLPKGLAEYEPLGQKVVVCVPPGRPKHHYPAPIVSCFEAYWYGMGCPPADWLPLPKFDAYCIQWEYHGTHGHHPPTVAQRDRLLSAVLEHHPKYIFLF